MCGPAVTYTYVMGLNVSVVGTIKASYKIQLYFPQFSPCKLATFALCCAPCSIYLLCNNFASNSDSCWAVHKVQRFNAPSAVFCVMVAAVSRIQADYSLSWQQAALYPSGGGVNAIHKSLCVSCWLDIECEIVTGAIFQNTRGGSFGIGNVRSHAIRRCRDTLRHVGQDWEFAIFACGAVLRIEVNKVSRYYLIDGRCKSTGKIWSSELVADVPGVSIVVDNPHLLYYLKQAPSSLRGVNIRCESLHCQPFLLSYANFF